MSCWRYDVHTDTQLVLHCTFGPCLTFTATLIGIGQRQHSFREPGDTVRVEERVDSGVAAESSGLVTA